MRRTVQTERFSLRVPVGVMEALERGAVRHRCNPSEFTRRLILDGLERHGVELPVVEIVLDDHGGRHA